MDKKNIQSIFPLNSTQTSLLFHSVQNPDADPGFLHVQFSLEGSLDFEALKLAWEKTTQQHEALRMSVQMPKGQPPMLVVCKSPDPNWYYEDISATPKNDQITRVESFLQNDKKVGLNLSDESVYRLAAFRINANNHKIVWTCHHLLLDGWSSTTILKDLMRNYDCIRSRSNEIARHNPTFRNYVAWSKAKPTEDAVQFWTNYLKEFKTGNSLASLIGDTFPNNGKKSCFRFGTKKCFWNQMLRFSLEV